MNITVENIKISFKPKSKHLDEIAEWKIDKRELFIKDSGSWASIIQSYENKELVIATYKNKTIGFYAFRYYDSSIHIDVAQVDFNFRRVGVARLLLDEIIKKYENKIYALHLFCEPKSSQKIWKKLGFKHFPKALEKDKTNGKIDMYRNVKPFLKPSKFKINSTEEREVIEIWNDEPYIVEFKKLEPNYIWKLKFKKGTRILVKPIVYFGHYEWRIRWRKGNKIFYDGKYKRFYERLRIKNDNFTFFLIKELPEKKD